MNSSFINYYKVLQVDSEAETDIIMSAYKRLALKYHPDFNKAPDAEEKMKLLNEAKRILTNPQERRKFDEQFARNSQPPQQAQSTPSYTQETVEEDVWDDRAIRNLAVLVLNFIQASLKESKWRIAREKLYAFEGLGTPSKDNRILPTFPMMLPEWQDAKKLNDLANEQARKFGMGLAFWSSLIYGFGLGFIGMLWFGIGTASNSNDIGAVILAGIFGAVAGFVVGVIAALIGTFVYSTWYAGKWGSGTDMLLGILAPLLLALVITFGIYIIIGYFFLAALISSLSSGSKRR